MNFLTFAGIVLFSVAVVVSFILDLVFINITVWKFKILKAAKATNPSTWKIKSTHLVNINGGKKYTITEVNIPYKDFMIVHKLSKDWKYKTCIWDGYVDEQSYRHYGSSFDRTDITTPASILHKYLDYRINKIILKKADAMKKAEEL